MAKNDPKRPKKDPKWPKGKHASSSIIECEEFILPDWSPPDDPARSWPSDDDDNDDDDDDNDDDDDDNYELEAIVSASLRPCQSPERGAALNPCNRPTLPIHLYVLVAAKMRTLCFSRPPSSCRGSFCLGQGIELWVTKYSSGRWKGFLVTNCFVMMHLSPNLYIQQLFSRTHHMSAATA